MISGPMQSCHAGRGEVAKTDKCQCRGERAEGLPSGSATGYLPGGLQSCIAHLIDYDPEQERQQFLDHLEENLVGGSP